MKFEQEKVIKEIKDNGYCIIDDFLDKDNLEKIRNSLLQTFNYIQKDDEKDLQKKFYKIKKYSKKLKGNWYDLAGRNIALLQYLHQEKIVDLVKKYFNTDVVFSGRSCIGAYDDENDHLLEPHQETKQISRDSILLWAPLYDTDKDHGGLRVYKDSHKHGYFDHTLDHPLGDKGWTNQYTHVDKSISSKFKPIDLEVKAGQVVLMISNVLHCGYPNKKKGSVRITVCERYNPLQKIPYLKDPKAEMKIPYTGVDYNKILD